MIEHWISISQLLANISTMLGFAIIIISIRSWKLSRQQMSQAIMVNCIGRFQDLREQLDCETYNPNVVRRYISLCNEELFYFRHNYLPKELQIEWLTGMLPFLPHFVKGENKNDKCKFAEEMKEIIIHNSFHRVEHSFTFDKMEYARLKNEPKLLAAQVLKNLRTFNL